MALLVLESTTRGYRPTVHIHKSRAESYSFISRAPSTQHDNKLSKGRTGTSETSLHRPPWLQACKKPSNTPPFLRFLSTFPSSPPEEEARKLFGEGQKDLLETQHALCLIWRHRFPSHHEGWTKQDFGGEVCHLPKHAFAFGYAHTTLGNAECCKKNCPLKCPTEWTDISKWLFNLLAAGWHLKRCYLTPWLVPGGKCISVFTFGSTVFHGRGQLAGKIPLHSGAAGYCNTLVWQRRLRCPCSCPGLQPGTLAEGASSHVQVFYDSQTYIRGPVPSWVCSWFYQLPF